MSDKSILDRINALIDEEHHLRSGNGMAPEQTTRLQQVEVELDQCWDLLRQRRAKREFGRDPETAQPREAGTVENYTG